MIREHGSRSSRKHIRVQGEMALLSFRSRSGSKRMMLLRSALVVARRSWFAARERSIEGSAEGRGWKVVHGAVRGILTSVGLALPGGACSHTVGGDGAFGIALAALVGERVCCEGAVDGKGNHSSGFAITCSCLTRRVAVMRLCWLHVANPPTHGNVRGLRREKGRRGEKTKRKKERE